MGITKIAKENYEELGLNLDRLKMLDSALQSYIDDGQRQAIVFKATRRGRTIFEKTYGRNTKEYGLKMDLLYSVQSVTKPVVAALILCLQEDGLLDITEPVEKYLPEFTGGGREDICLWHLMTHTSGIFVSDLEEFEKEYVEKELNMKAPGGDDFDWEGFINEVKEKMNISADATGRMADPEYLISLKMPIKRKPHVEMDYLGYGFTLLKEVIEEVSDKTIDEYAQERMFKSLGMKDSYWKLPKKMWDRVIGREEDAVNGKWFNSEHNYTSENGAWGLKTTVDDITKFMLMILNDGKYNGKRVMSKATVAQFFVNHNQGVISEGSEEYASWTYGWNLHGNKKDAQGTMRSHSAIDHTGFGGTWILVDPVYEITIACFGVENVYYTEPEFLNINGRVGNLLISALED